jgi:hypothetical protein
MARKGSHRTPSQPCLLLRPPILKLFNLSLLSTPSFVYVAP